MAAFLSVPCFPLVPPSSLIPASSRTAYSVRKVRSSRIALSSIRAAAETSSTRQITSLFPKPAEQARTTAQKAKICVLSILAKPEGSEEFFPQGILASCFVDENGLPIISVAKLPEFTSQPKNASVTMLQDGFDQNQAAWITLTGTLTAIEEDKLVPGDKAQFRLTMVQSILFSSNYGEQSIISTEGYMSAEPDPLQDFIAPVANHMNKDHEDDLIRIINHFVPEIIEEGTTLKSAKMIGFDKRGMDLIVSGEHSGGDEHPKSWCQRVPFPFEVLTRKNIKEALVEMTNAVTASS
mmetsp:Transcript_5833/g.10313  ORF Transcript_5833/g.10313 Transcript_5833/m.10313 type:complete len:295 (+) Transcript_5833:1535-2419(+)|eukprot:CAMPEP_0182448508 /NCGR_PEP_ID=MMETSP1172-20130603/27655_1 /TAXON_ID=708627 /ORGANISM="Timspurckia oligopyrenoides, Strain CCMP3278" /LENGTH=294 /DNA_ID=CAMNT_0024645403 /DNA_START=1502 /DNA_END=2386 /DNA_ORIENTATION=+